MSIEYIKENKNYYEETIKELKEKVEYYQRRSQRQQQEIDRLKTAYELMERKYLKQEDYKSRNKKAIEFIIKNKKSISKEVTEGTRLSVGTFMWNIDELLNILRGISKGRAKKDEDKV